MIYYASELIKSLRDILDGFNTYHIPIIVDGKNIKEIKVDDKDGYKINVELKEV